MRFEHDFWGRTMLSRMMGIFLLLTAGLTSGMAGNAPVCTIGMVTSSDSMAVVQVRVRGFKSISACDLKIKFSTSVASFEKITFGNGVSFAAFSVNTELLKEGIIRCGGYFNAGVTLSDESIFLNLHFKKKNTGSTTVTFIDDEDSFSCLFYDSNLNALIDVPYADYYVNGLLSFTAERVAPVTAIPDVKACQGDAVDFPVTVRNFSNIGVVALSMSYDHNVLMNPVFTNTSGKMSLSPDLSTPGLIKVMGFNLTQDGESLPEGAVFFTLSFTYAGGESAVRFNHTTPADCQYKTPSPGFVPISDNPKSAFFSDGSVTPASFSDYAMNLTAPGRICSGETAGISVNLANNTPAGQCAQGNGLLKITATGPGDVTFRFNTGTPSFTSFVNSGYVGPSGGFLLSPEINLDLLGNVDFSQPGLYTIDFRLEDAVSGHLIDGISETRKISVDPLPLPTLSGPVDVCAFSSGHAYVTEAGKSHYAWTVSGGKITAGGGVADHSVVVTWESAGNGLLSVSYTNSGSECSPAVPSSLAVQIDLCSVVVKGNLKYLNEARSPLKDVRLFLTLKGDTAYTTTTDKSGNYEFPSVLPGDYSVRASFPLDGTGAVNSVDAGSVYRWQSGLQPSVEKVRFLAGDVDGNRNLGAADATLINRLFLQVGQPSWPDSIGRWSLWKSDDPIQGNPFPDGIFPVLHVGHLPVNQNFYGLATGDFNMGFSPGTSGNTTGNGSVSLVEGQMMNGIPGEEFILPVKAASDVTVGAFSLVLDYPRESVKLVTVFRGVDQNDTIPFHLLDDQLRIGWYSAAPMVLKKEEPLFSLKVKVLPQAFTGTEIKFSLMPAASNELADGEMKLLTGVDLSATKLKVVSTYSALPVETSAFSIKAFPNPAGSSFTLSYTVPEMGLASIMIIDKLGKVLKIMQVNSSSGKNEMMMDLTNFAPGMYYIKLDYFSGSDRMSLSEKLLIWR